MQRFRELLIRTIELMMKQKRAILSLSVVVVFITTYLLILPAFTLEKQKAAEQGGIDVPGITAISDYQTESNIDSDDSSADVVKNEDISSDYVKEGDISSDAVNNERDSSDADIAEDEDVSTNEDITAETIDDEDISDDLYPDNTVLSASVNEYDVTVSFGSEAEIPDGAELNVTEIEENDDIYDEIRNTVDNGLEKGKESIPSHPVMLDISIMYGGIEIEPAEGSEVKVEVKLAADSIKGLYTDEESPVLINDKPVTDESSKMDTEIQVLHMIDDETVDVMDTEDKITEEEVTSIFTTDSFSNWLVYLDEDLTDINVTTSDSITLRPYSEWVWKSEDEPTAYQGGQWDFSTSDWNVSYQGERVNGQWVNNYYTIYTHKTNGSQFRSFQKTDNELNETYTVVTSVSLNAGDFDIKTNKGKTIHVHVTQGQSSPKPPTVQGIPDLKVNLFDYDVPYPQGQSSGFDFTRSGNLDVSSNTALNPDNSSVNSPYLGDNRDFKFLGWGSNDSLDQEWCWINNYTHDDPNQNIVKSHLDSNGYPELEVSQSGWEHGNKSLDYLFDTSSRTNSVYAFPDAGGLFQLDNQGYYYYNSNTNYAEYDQDSNSFVLYSHTYSQNTGGSNGANAKPIGFFPFHEYDTSNTQSSMNHNQDLNHHFGMSMELDFEIPKDRQMEDQGGNKHDIIYEFSGDDDLWVFIDDELVLDIGGIHQPVTGSINFTTGVITVHGVDDITKTFDVGGHTLKMFYIERGGCDSNLSVRFNLPLTIANAAFNITKKSAVDGSSDSDKALQGAQFGIWENPDCEGEPYLTATSDTNGKVDFGDLPIKEEDQTYYLKEIKAPDGYLTSTKIYTLNAVKDNDNTYHFTVSDGEQSLGQEPIIRNFKPVPIDLSLHKEWQDAAGNAIDRPDVQAEFELKRFKTYIKETPQDPIPTGQTTVYAGRVQPSGSWQTTTLATASIKRGTNATITWSYNSNYNGQRQYRYSTNGGDNGGTWNYSAQNLNRNGSAQIAVPASGELLVYFYDEWNSAVSVSISGAPDQIDQDPLQEVVTEPDNDYSQTVILPRNSSYDYTFEDLPVQAVRNNVVYDYTYYIVEKTVPEGYDSVYVDGNGKVINDPSSLSTNQDGTQTIINRKDVDVPVEKYWPDYSGDEFTWTATFVLEQMEVKVNEGDPDAADAITAWEAVEGRDPLTVSKDQNPLPEFKNLPMYRVHSNGTVYRILYSVEEVAYEVKENGNVIAQWVKDGSSSGDRYTPQFVQDAGSNGADISNYKIILINTIADFTATKEIDLGIKKTWPEETSYSSDEDAYAQFVLKRYVHEEYRRYENVTEDTEWVTVTLVTSSAAQEEGSRRQTLTVPKGTTLHIMGQVRGSTNANKIVFSQSSGQDNIEYVKDNTGSTDPSPIDDLTVTADQTKTISLVQGDNFVVGGRDGFRLSDYNNRTTDRLDNSFEEHFTLNSENDWEKLFKYLSVVEESSIDPTVADQTIYVYSYFLEEVECNPGNYEPTFKDSYGNILGNISNSVDFSTDIIAENNKKTGALEIIKNVTVDGDPAYELPEGRKSLADGTYTFRVYEADGTTVAKLAGSTVPLEDITITISGGVSNSAVVTGLYVGDYVVKEVGSDNPNVSLDVDDYNVTVSEGQTASAGATASITNDYVTTGITVQKIWQNADGSVDNSKSGDISFTLIQTAYTYDPETGEEIAEVESAVTSYNGQYRLQIGDDDAQIINNQPLITFSSDTNVSISDLPLYGFASGSPVKYHYYVRESAIDGYTGIETQDGEGNWTLVNRPAADTDEDTNLNVTKLWKDKDGNPATLTGDEEIEFVIKQKAVKTDYVPVTIHLYNPISTTEANSKTIYVKKGTIFSYTVDEETLAFSHYVNVSVNGGTAIELSNGSTRTINITGPTSIVAAIQSSGLSLFGRWASAPWSGDNTDYYRWTFDYSNTQYKIETIDELVAQYADVTDGVTESEFRYEMLNNSITAKTDEVGEVTAQNFVASFTNLPLFRQVGTDAYTYYYSVSEVKVNGEEVVNNQTEDYIVTYNEAAAGTTITNTEKEKISVNADKTWTNADGTTAPPEGATVTFELYRNDVATGKRVVLNGKIDVADDADVVDTATHEKNAEAIEAKAYEPVAWKATWENLNKYQDDGTTEYVYTIREVTGFTGYTAINDTAAAGGTINNEQKTTSLDIVKVDNSDTDLTLEGAKFTIRKIKDTLGANDIQYDGPESDPVTTDDEGKAGFSGITYGYYEIRETDAPEGYNIPDDACFYIRYDDDGIKLLEKDLTKDPKSWDATKTEVGKVSLHDSTATVKNESGAELPMTGGIGTTIFYILGSIMLLGCAVVLIARKRILDR